MRTQDSGLQAYYWPHRTVGIPVNVERDRQAQRTSPPTSNSTTRSTAGPFQKGPKLPLNSMQSLDGGKKGFLFTAERDGDYEFAVQFVYADGSTNPRTDELERAAANHRRYDRACGEDLADRTTASSGSRPTTTSTRAA